MNANDASFSDLETARRLSQSLAKPYNSDGEPGVPALARAPRFSARGAAEQRRKLVERKAAQTQGEREYGPAAWNSLLDACVAAVGAEAAFALSANGLLVALRGQGSAAELEPLGAQLLAMMDQAERIEQRQEGPASVAIRLGQRWLAGVRLVGDEELALGLLCRRPLGERDWQRLTPLLGLTSSST